MRAIVVFGCLVHPSGEPSRPLVRRLRTALALAEQDTSAWVAVSGGSVWGPAEGPIMGEWLAARGVQRERLILEARARHTRDNAERLEPLLRPHGVRHLTLVTERYHLWRSEVLLRRSLQRAGCGDWQVDAVAAPDELAGARLWRRRASEAVKLAGERWRMALEA